MQAAIPAALARWAQMRGHTHKDTHTHTKTEVKDAQSDLKLVQASLAASDPMRATCRSCNGEAGAGVAPQLARLPPQLFARDVEGEGSATEAWMARAAGRQLHRAWPSKCFDYCQEV